MTDPNAKSKSQESVIRRVVHSPLFVAAGGICVILVALGFDSIKGSVSREGMMIGGGIFLFLCITNMVINAVVNKLHNQDYFDQRLEILNNMILNNNLNWLVNEKYVQMLEIQADEIWAFAPELTYSIQPGTEIYKAVVGSLARGCTYKIFMPNKPDTHKIIADYRRVHKFKPGQVEFILIPHEEYVFHTIISIYNPRSDFPKAIEWLPVENLVAWIEMDPKHVGSVIGIGAVLIKRYLESTGEHVDAGFVKEVPRGMGKAVIQAE